MVFTTLNENNFDKRPTRQQYVVKGVMWIITHTLTLVFVYYGKYQFLSWCHDGTY